MTGASSLRAGSTIRITSTGERAVVWSLAPDASTYWVHLIDRVDRPLRLIRVKSTRSSLLPVVTLEG